MLPHPILIPHSRPTIEADDIAAVGAVLASGFLAQGKEVRAFEEEMAAFLGLRGGIATSSGTAALHLALLALGVGQGAEVLVPSYTCVALLHAVHLAGARPRIVDVEPEGVNMWVEDAARHVSLATAAIIVPHMFGEVASVEALRMLGVPIIENCAQALGATLQGKPVGSFGDLTVLSFYATKMMTTGEGGMLLSRSQDLLAEVRDLRDYDGRSDYRLRFNYKMTDMQAALGRSQLRKLPRFLDQRRAVARSYHAALDGVVPSYTPPRENTACYRYVIAVPDVSGFAREMLIHGIECKGPVFRPLHELASAALCPHTDKTYRQAVSLPIYPSLTLEKAEAIGRFVAQTVGNAPLAVGDATLLAAHRGGPAVSVQEQEGVRPGGSTPGR